MFNSKGFKVVKKYKTLLKRKITAIFEIEYIIYCMSWQMEEYSFYRQLDCLAFSPRFWPKLNNSSLRLVFFYNVPFNFCNPLGWDR